jgi:glucokinase
MKKAVIGIDLGGTNIKAGAVDMEGRVLTRHRRPTGADAGPKAVAEHICKAARNCIDALEDCRIAGVGVGSPGTIDLHEGVVLFSPNMPGWEDIPLRAWIEEDLDMPCVLENDANSAALGEQWVGAGRGADSLVMFTLGTGIGGGVVLDGRVWHGTGGFAGEIGHMCIDPEGPECGCGSRGCIEAHASATGMVRRMQQEIDAGRDTLLAEQSGGFTAKDIYEAALKGDEAAQENFADTGRFLGVAISNMLHILNPAVVVLSGGVTAAGDMLLKPIRAEVRDRTMDACQRDVRISIAELGEDAGFIGAARSFMNRNPEA